jgi:uncharacterized protein YdeI (YjbR/CyaY-like superfamily)
MNPIFFANQTEFRKWLENNYKKSSELWVGFYKVKTKKPSMTWSESVDQAICFGWIDGVRRSIDEDSYCIRFTPRRKTSNWSAVNIKKVANLTKLGLMKPEGLEAYANRKKRKSETYSFENKRKKLNVHYKNTFKANKIAWDFFNKQAPYYQKTIIHWVMSAKKETTQISRLEKLIAASEKLTRL